MNLSEQIYNYCERGTDPSLWAEPFNALSNAGFLAAAVSGLIQLRRLPSGRGTERAQRMVLGLLVALVAAIGIGSFLFHTFATRWALVADVGPITVFMVAYLAYALRVFLGLGWAAIAIALVSFLLVGNAAGAIECVREGAKPEPCLNGSLGYLPALVSLLVVGGLCRFRDRDTGRALLTAGAIFLVSVGFRVIDREVCGATQLLGHVRGTHAIWHGLNAITLYVLLRAAIDDVRNRAG